MKVRGVHARDGDAEEIQHTYIYTHRRSKKTKKEERLIKNKKSYIKVKKNEK